MKQRIHQTVILLYVIIPFLGLIAGMVLLWNSYFSATDLILLLVFQCIGVIGITIGYHRMLTHMGFKTYRAVRYFFVICGCMALEGAPLSWVATHIKHHAHSDEEDDPHSPMKSFFHAHLGWLFSLSSFADPAVYCPELRNDPAIKRIDDLYWVWGLLALGVPALIGGWSGFIWGGLVRVLLTTHVTWSVNSICHTFGSRGFETTDESRNNWLIGLLAFGEGWHNNHHAFPTNAFHGLRWWQFDLSGLIIRTMEITGLAWDVQRVSTSMQQAHLIRGKSMHESIADMKADLGAAIDYARVELNKMILKLPSQKVAMVRYAHEETMKRLSEIQLKLERRRNVKKATLLRRQQEVEDLLAEAKHRLNLLQAV